MPARTPTAALFGDTLYERAVLVDTAALLALATRLGEDYEACAACLIDLEAHRFPVFVTIPTILETHRRLLYDLGRPEADAFLTDIYDGSVSIVRPIEADDVRARDMARGTPFPVLTLTDAINMAVMLRLGIAKAFTLDDDFQNMGFLRMPPFI